MADQQHVEAEAGKVLDAVLSTGDHTEGGAAVDETIAAKAQVLAASEVPAEELVTLTTLVSEPQSVAPVEAEGEQRAEESVPTPAGDEHVAATPEAAEGELAGQEAGAAESPPQKPTPSEDAPAVEEPAEEPSAAEPPAFEGEVAAPAPTSAEEVNEAPAVPEEPAAVAAPAQPEPTAPSAGTKRPAEDGAPAEEEPAAKTTKFEIDPEDPNAEYFNIIMQIPAGQTRTFSDIAVGAGAKPTAARSIGRTVAKIANDTSTGLPWWRVVSAVGALQSNPARQEVQLERLRAEGARPMEGEGVTEWAARVGAKVVGAYALGSMRLVYADYDNDDVTTFNPHAVEPFESKEAAVARGFSRV